jgi:hypothetical protein
VQRYGRMIHVAFDVILIAHGSPQVFGRAVMESPAVGTSSMPVPIYAFLGSAAR